MPEIAEIARTVHFLRKTLVGKTIAKVTAQEDANVFGKVGCSAGAFEKALLGKKVLEAGQQGKYFWLILSKPPHPVFHFGMTGWFHIRGEQTYYYKSKDTDKGPDKDPFEPGEAEWPPKYWKFVLETKETPKVEAAFTDSRRFARIRLVDCDAKEIRNTTPLKENGPDPVIDRDILTLEWLTAKMKKKHVPVKALLLDQANISGIGNWVGDEIMYHAKLHPEQYSDTFSNAQLKQLHTSILYVCKTAVDCLGDSSQFPEEWLFKHRWGKGKKDAPKTLPNGEKITHITVGGRTSAVVPSVQKKTGPVAGEGKRVKEEIEGDGEEEERPNKKVMASRGKKIKDEEEEAVNEDDEEKPIKKPSKAAKTKAGGKAKANEAKKVKKEVEEEEDGEEPADEDEEEKPAAKPVKAPKPKAGGKAKKSGATEEAADTTAKPEVTGRRRSTRTSGKG